MSSDLDSSGLSHIGPIRDDNQDAIRLTNGDTPLERGCLFAVADGMGGYAHGQVASALALERLFEAFYQDHASPTRALRCGIETANLGVYETAQQLGAGRMGTTLTAAGILGSQLYLAHVGDSRAYLIRAGKATCLTNDHTTVGDLVRMRVLAPDKVRTHAQRSILTRGVGLGLFIQPDVTQHTLHPDDWLILCSDGVWSVIEDDEFAQLALQAHTAVALNQDLIDLALARQTDDNSSAIVVHFRLISSHLSANKPHRIGLLQRLFRYRNTGI